VRERESRRKTRVRERGQITANASHARRVQSRHNKHTTQTRTRDRISFAKYNFLASLPSPSAVRPRRAGKQNQFVDMTHRRTEQRTGVLQKSANSSARMRRSGFVIGVATISATTLTKLRDFQPRRRASRDASCPDRRSARSIDLPRDQMSEISSSSSICTPLRQSTDRCETRGGGEREDPHRRFSRATFAGSIERAP